VNGIRRCNHPIETYLAVISDGTQYLICFVFIVLTFESVDETLWRENSNETSLLVPPHGDICF